MEFSWVDYGSADAPLVDGWLDEEAVAMTGISEGWQNYWQAVQADAVNFPGCRDLCKVVHRNDDAVAAVVFGVFRGEAVVSELVVAPYLRGKGLGSAILRELAENLPRPLDADVKRVTAVVFSNNTASRQAFLKAGFRLESEDEAAGVCNFEYHF